MDVQGNTSPEVSVQTYALMLTIFRALGFSRAEAVREAQGILRQLAEAVPQEDAHEPF